MPGIRDWWNLTPPAPTPSARYYHAMVYDSARGKIVVFGGYTGSASLGDTWEYDPVANTWTNRAPASAPPARYYHAMVYDSARGKIVLFGGHSGPYALGDTWEYDPVANTWINRAPVGSPARYQHAMVYDSARGKIVLFGGTTGGNETWEYDPVANTWISRTPASTPSARFAHAMVYDSAREKIVLFGGTTGGNETWELWLKLALLFAKTTGQPADNFNFGSVIANNVLGPAAVDLWNGTGTTVSIAQVSIPDIPAGEVIELSKTADPFIPESPLVFSGTFSNNTKIGTLYVRIKPPITSSGDKQFTLSATSTPA